MMMTTRFPRIRRRVKGIGLVQLATDTKKRREHDRRVVLFDELVEAGQLSVIRALVAGVVSWGELVDHRREAGSFGVSVLTEVKLRRPLVQAVSEALPRMGKAKATRKRYETTWNRLKTVLPADVLTVADLGPRGDLPGKLDWQVLRSSWQRSASDWNHVVRFLSAFLSTYLGKRHPFRGTVVDSFPWAKESPRVPDLTPALFWKIVDLAPTHARASYVALLLSGMRVRSEYLRCSREHLMAATHQVRIPDDPKTQSSAGTVSIEKADWRWIDQAIPSRLQYKWLRLYWCRAAVAAGAARWDPKTETGYQGPTMHSLRHCLAQWATDAGVPLVDVKAQLRHANMSTTETYARRSRSRATSKAVSKLMRRKTA